MDDYLKKAIAEYEQYLADGGGAFFMDAATMMDIEEYYEKNGRDYDAEHILRLAEKLHPDSEDVLLIRAYRLKTAGKWDEALAMAHRVKDEENRDLQFLEAEWDLAGGDFFAAHERIISRVDMNMTDGDADEWRCDFADMLLDYGYATQVPGVLAPIGPKSKQRHRADEQLGDAYYQTGRYAEAAKIFGKLVDADVYDSFSWTLLAEVQDKQNQFADCVSSCDYAIAIDPSNSRAVELKMHSLFNLRKVDEAMQTYRQYGAKNPKLYTLRIYMGEHYNMRQQYAKAAEILSEGLRYCPIDSLDRQRAVTAMATALIGMARATEARPLMLTLTLNGVSTADATISLAGLYLDAPYDLQRPAMSLLLNLVQSPSCSEADDASVINVLASRQLWNEARPIWEYLAVIEYSKDYNLIYAYCAFALFHIKNYQLFVNVMGNALAARPDLVRDIFSTLAGTRELGTILRYIADETAKWPDAPANDGKGGKNGNGQDDNEGNSENSVPDTPESEA